MIVFNPRSGPPACDGKLEQRDRGMKVSFLSPDLQDAQLYSIINDVENSTEIALTPLCQSP